MKSKFIFLTKCIIGIISLAYIIISFIIVYFYIIGVPYTPPQTFEIPLVLEVIDADDLSDDIKSISLAPLMPENKDIVYHTSDEDVLSEINDLFLETELFKTKYDYFNSKFINSVNRKPHKDSTRYGIMFTHNGEDSSESTKLFNGFINNNGKFYFNITEFDGKYIEPINIKGKLSREDMEKLHDILSSFRNNK